MEGVLDTYLTFTLGNETFAFNIDNVKEVLEVSVITNVPGLSSYMLGVINLREKVIPVMDLRQRLGMESVQRTVNSAIIIAEVGPAGTRSVMGILVDSVREVLELKDADIEPQPDFGGDSRSDYIKAIAKYTEHFIIILEINRVFSSKELALATDIG